MIYCMVLHDFNMVVRAYLHHYLAQTYDWVNCQVFRVSSQLFLKVLSYVHILEKFYLFYSFFYRYFGKVLWLFK